MVAMWLAPLVSPALCNLFILERLVPFGDRAEDGLYVGLIVGAAQWVALKWRGGAEAWVILFTAGAFAFAEASVQGVVQGFPAPILWAGLGCLIGAAWGNGLPRQRLITIVLFALLSAAGFAARAYLFEQSRHGLLVTVADALPALWAMAAMARGRAELNAAASADVP